MELNSGERASKLVTKVGAASANVAQQRTMKRTSVDHTPTKGFAMACFVVPAAEGAVVKVIEQKAKKSGENTEACARRVERLGRLSKMLWGGSALLAFEHV
jgi:D-alanine-D-alanine ligase-like ATP-grasp enzyme